MGGVSLQSAATIRPADTKCVRSSNNAQATKERGICIQLRGRSWEDIEKSIAALSLHEGRLATSDDIGQYLVFLTILPLPIKGMIADYASICTPLPEPQNSIFQLRMYALYKSGRVRECVSGISSLRAGHTIDYPRHSALTYPAHWLNKLASEAFFLGDSEVARVAWICANTSAETQTRIAPHINMAFALALSGNFAGSLAMANGLSGSAYGERIFLPLVRGWALAGLEMYEEALVELSKCIQHSNVESATAKAVELKRAIEVERSLDAPVNKTPRLDWILETYRKAVAATDPHSYDHRDISYPVPEFINISFIRS